MRHFSKTRMGFLTLCVVIAGGCFEKSAATDPVSDSNLKLQRVFPELDFSQPVALLPEPNKDNQLWVVEKQGRVFRIVQRQGQYTKEMVVDITDRVNSRPNEAGLLGLAFHPQYSKNHQIFLSYTAQGPRLTSTISRFMEDAGRIVPGSEQVLLQVEQPYGNHNGGQIAFGPDGLLYIGFGDGGSAGDPKGNGQNPNTLLGAMLRIDVDNGAPYGIPTGNPFASSDDGRGEIYAWGMRNPWRWSFDRKTGELWVADVGQNHWEEIDVVRQGGNYAWNIKEGRHCYASSHCEKAALAANVVEPVAEYSHAEGCSVTGGYVYRGERIKALQGTYLFGDFCSGRIWGLSPGAESGKTPHVLEKKLLNKSGLMISSFAEDNQGEIYVIHYEGEIYKIVPAEK